MTWSIVGLIAVFVAVRFVVGRVLHARPVPAATWAALPAEPTLREHLLASAPLPTPADDPDETIAVLVDFALGGDTVTLMVATDGSTSLYTSRGGGVLGMGAKPAVREAAAAVLAAEPAARAAFDAPLPEGFPYPSSRAVTFWRVTLSGARTTGPVAIDAIRLAHPLGPLTQASMRAVEAVRTSAPGGA